MEKEGFGDQAVMRWRINENGEQESNSRCCDVGWLISATLCSSLNVEVSLESWNGQLKIAIGHVVRCFLS